MQFCEWFSIGTIKYLLFVCMFVPWAFHSYSFDCHETFVLVLLPTSGIFFELLVFLLPFALHSMPSTAFFNGENYFMHTLGFREAQELFGTPAPMLGGIPKHNPRFTLYAGCRGLRGMPKIRPQWRPGLAGTRAKDGRVSGLTYPPKRGQRIVQCGRGSPSLACWSYARTVNHKYTFKNKSKILDKVINGSFGTIHE